MQEYKLVNGMNDIQWLNDKGKVFNLRTQIGRFELASEFLALSDDANTLFRVV